MILAQIFEPSTTKQNHGGAAKQMLPLKFKVDTLPPVWLREAQPWHQKNTTASNNDLWGDIFDYGVKVNWTMILGFSLTKPWLWGSS